MVTSLQVCYSAAFLVRMGYGMNAPLKVLLVEDDANDVLFLRRAVSKLALPWTVELAVDGDEAIRRLRADGAANHVLLDLKIPRKSGLEVLKTVRAAHPQLRVVVLTSSAERTDQERARTLGVEAYFVKPVNFDEFLGIVREIAAMWAAREDA